MPNTTANILSLSLSHTHTHTILLCSCRGSLLWRMEWGTRTVPFSIMPRPLLSAGYVFFFFFFFFFWAIGTNFNVFVSGPQEVYWTRRGMELTGCSLTSRCPWLAFSAESTSLPPLYPRFCKLSSLHTVAPLEWNLHMPRYVLFYKINAKFIVSKCI